MTKINDSGGAKPTPPKDFDLEKEILEGVFKNNEDDVRGSTIGIEAMRAINPKFDTGGVDLFDSEKRIDIGADKKPEPDFDPKKGTKGIRSRFNSSDEQNIDATEPEEFRQNLIPLQDIPMLCIACFRSSNSDDVQCGKVYK